MFVSPQLRAIQTAEEINRNLGIILVVRKELREVNAGEGNGKTREWYKEHAAPRGSLFDPDHKDFPDAESDRELWNRLLPFYLDMMATSQTYDRDALCCGAPCWRWAYHALHSADKWFINPCVYEEPPFHEEGLDNPEKPASIILTDEQLLDYLDQIERKTYDYLDSLTDEMLYECPENCEHTRMELVLRQFRHISFHTGMLNGQTAVAMGKFPMWVSQADQYVDDGIFFGRYRKGRITK